MEVDAATRELDAVNRHQDINSHGRPANLVKEAFLGKIIRASAGERRAELNKAPPNFRGVFRIGQDPHVEILCCITAYPPTMRYLTSLALKILNSSSKSEFMRTAGRERVCVDGHLPGSLEYCRGAEALPVSYVEGAVHVW
jgi:hypothetical protein